MVGGGSRGGVGVLLAFLALLSAACSPDELPPLPPSPGIAEPDPAEVETVVFLLGDAGQARERYHPIIPRLASDVERWAEALGRDSAVVLLNLGDVVYPDGLHPPGHPSYPRDSARVQDQVDVLGGPAAREHRAFGLFAAGNHDWGTEEHHEGMSRLLNLEGFLDRARAGGIDVRLVPEAGDGGPYVLDLGAHLRLVLLDTAWWLLGADPAAREDVLAGVDEAVREAGGRSVVMAAHHPYRTAGPHGGRVEFWESLGVRWILHRTGAILQDLTSVPYRLLRSGLAETFDEEHRPLVFAGGHEHSLQVIEGVEPSDPGWILVSGSASKLTRVGHAEGMVYRAAEPGYMRLMVLRDGSVLLFVESAPAEFLSCPADEPERTRCMDRGVAEYEVVHSRRLR